MNNKKREAIEELNKRLLQEGSDDDMVLPRTSFQVMIDKLNMGREMGEPDLSQMVDEVILILTSYRDKPTMSDNDRLGYFGGR